MAKTFPTKQDRLLAIAAWKVSAEGAFAAFLRNPTANNYELTLHCMKEFQEAEKSAPLSVPIVDS